MSAYSLFELPSREFRLETILKLWKKTEKYLIIVEEGTDAGFTVDLLNIIILLLDYIYILLIEFSFLLILF